MEETKNNQSAKKNDDCPLCKVSEETIERLKAGEKEKTSEEKDSAKKKSYLGLIFWLTVIIFLGGGFIFYQIYSGQSEKTAETENTLGAAGITESIPKIPEVGKPIPFFDAEDIDGNKIVLRDLLNQKPVLLVFWATWCGFCAQELNDMKTFTEKHQEIQVLAMASGESKETVKDYIFRENVNFSMTLDEKRDIWNQYSVRGTPAHFLINRDGTLASLRPGLSFLKDLETMLTMLK